jgi:hypothetical protein
MAIILKCSRCKEHLEVDDAFAGGICRCVHCGSLSEVPLQTTVLDRKGRPTVPPPMAKPVITPPRGELAARIAPTRQYALSVRRMSIMAVIMIVASVVMLTLFILLLVKMMKDNKGDDKPDKKTQSVNNSPEPTPIPQVAGPAFVAMPLPDGAVAYLLNVGTSMQDSRDLAGLAILDSVKRLEGRSFLLSPWVEDNADVSELKPLFPEKGLAKAGTSSGLADWLTSVDHRFVPDPARAAKEAVARGAAVLVLITCKDIDAKTCDLLAAATAGKKVAWRAVAIDSPAGPISDYPELVRLTGDAKNVQRLSGDELKAWLGK